MATASASTPASAQPVRGTGAKADPFDGRDRYYVPLANTKPAKNVDVRKQVDVMKIYNQGQTGSCTANAAAAAFWFEEKLRGDRSWGDAGPSRAFIYWLARGGYDAAKQYGIDEVTDDGSWLRRAMYGIATCGACPELDHPFADISKIKDIQSAAVNKKPSPLAFQKAKTHTINSYFRLDPDRPTEQDDNLTIAQKDTIGAYLLRRLKCCLTEGFPVCFTMWFYLPLGSSWEQKPSTSPPNEHRQLIDPWKTNKKLARHTMHGTGDMKGLGGHSVIAVGYDDARGQVLVQNSWGGPEDERGWGTGLFWMPYSWITDFYATVDFWTIRINQSAPPPGTSPVRYEQINKEALAHA